MSENQLKQDNPGTLLVEYAVENINLHNRSPSNDLKSTENLQLRQSSNNVQQYETSRQVYTGGNTAAFQHTEQSFNEVRDNYAEQAFNDVNQNTPPSREPEKPLPDENAQTHYNYEQAPPPGIPAGGDHSRKFGVSGSREKPPLYNSEHMKAGISEGYQKKIDKLDGKLKQSEDKDKKLDRRKDRRLRYAYGRIIYEAGDVWSPNKLLTRENAHVLKVKKNGNLKDKSITKVQLPGRLKFKAVASKKVLSEEKHDKILRREARRDFEKRAVKRKAYSEAKEYLDYEDIPDDDDVSAAKQAAKKGYRGAAIYTRRNLKTLRKAADPYKRINLEKQKAVVLQNKKSRLQFRAGKDYIARKARGYAIEGIIPEGSKYYEKYTVDSRFRDLKNTGKAPGKDIDTTALQKREGRLYFQAEKNAGHNSQMAAEQVKRQQLSAQQHRRLKKEMVKAYKQEQGNFIARVKNQAFTKRASRKYQKMKRKRNLSIITSLAGLFFVAVIAVLIIVFFMTFLSDIFVESVVNTTSQNDYYDMTDVTEYFREKEADLEEYLLPENIERTILEEYPDIYEFKYDLADISFDANTLVAYLSAKYNEFTLADVKAELDAILNEYYTLTIEVKEEGREIDSVIKTVQICYVKLTKKNFSELLLSRIENEAIKLQMQGYYLTGNGQQVYGPVMEADWRNKISSNFGIRVHPITGEKKMHDGVDIAVPTGTRLYSAVEGTVIRSYYSDSGGNMITVQNDSGWTVTFMHMDSRAVTVGQKVQKGQYVGTSGNTGNSTGPHLHIQVHDQDDKAINPVFIIPFSTTENSETFN